MKYFTQQPPPLINAQICTSEQCDRMPAVLSEGCEPLISRQDALLVDAESDDDAALTSEERQRREAEVMSDLLDIERQEAALV